MIHQILEKAAHQPKNIFLVDGCGAMLSAFLLGVVLVKFESLFGIPSSTLYTLATLPILFTIYDLYSYRQKEEKMGRFLKGIAAINLLYCCLSIGFAFFHLQTITYFGWAYLILEVLIVITISTLELKVANRLNQKIEGKAIPNQRTSTRE